MNHGLNKTRQAGFTLIELMLAMSFLSVLLLTIAMTIIQIGTIYNKGTVIKDINQSARIISEDVLKSAAEAREFTLSTDFLPASGRMCFGNSSYIWNTIDVIETGTPFVNKYQDTTRNDIRFVKVADSAKLYCQKQSDGSLSYQTIRSVDTSRAQEMLAAGDHKLTITQITVPTTSIVTEPSISQTLLTLNFTLASGASSALTDDRQSCRGPGDPNSNLTYCNVQPFSIVLRVGNRS